MRNNIKTILFCCGCLSALAMAPVYIWPLLFIGYSCLVYALLVKADTVKKTALFTFLFFFGYFLTGLYWTSSSLFVDFDKWWWALPFSFAGLPILLSLIPTALMIAGTFLPRYKTFAIVATLIVSDLVRSFIFTGFPWNMPIHGFIKSDAVMAALPYLGFHPLNALIIILLAVPALIIFYGGKHKKPVLAVFAVLILTAGYGINIKQPASPVPANIIMVQTNIPQTEKWDPAYIDRNFNRYIEMSSEAVRNDQPVLVVWPETAISQYLLSYPHIRKRFYEFLSSLPKDSHLITGYLYQNEKGYFNALAILDTEGTIVDIYDKHHLVPFGEYMPFGLDTLTGVSNFQHGTIPEPITIETTKLQILPLICYEIIFSSYGRRATENSIIVNITNDSWFGKTAGPYQHFDHAVFRATENRKTVLRLSGNGLSGVITADGKILHPTLLNQQATIVTE